MRSFRYDRFTVHLLESKAARFLRQPAFTIRPKAGDHRLESFAQGGQAICDVARDAAALGALDNTVALEQAQPIGKGLGRDAVERTEEFAVAAFSFAQVAQDEECPLAAHKFGGACYGTAHAFGHRGPPLYLLATLAHAQGAVKGTRPPLKAPMLCCSGRCDVKRTIVYAGASVAGERGVAVRDGRIAGLGDPSVLCRHFGDATVRTVRGVFFPAALDGHLHLVEYGLSLNEVDLRGLGAQDALLRLSAARAELPRTAFLRGYGARPTVLSEIAVQRDAVADLGPLRLWAQDFHTALTDPSTVERLGLDHSVPEGGETVRDARGRVTGILLEAAANVLAEAAKPLEADLAPAAQRAIQALWRQGIVGAVTFERAAGEAAVAAATEAMPFRAFVYRYADDLHPDEVPRSLTTRATRVGAKYFMDGTLGSRTAWMQMPYCDRDTTGIARLDPVRAMREMHDISARGFALAVHAIGDRAALAALEMLRAMPIGHVPHRIEHLQIVPEGFAEAIARAGVTASVQPCHLEQDLEEARRAWSDRLMFTYPYRAFLAAGARVAFGSDAPIEEPSLRLGMRWATGADLIGGDVRHAVTEEEAWLAYTKGVYESVGRLGGRIAVGEPANLSLYAHGPLQDEGPTLVLSEGVLVHSDEGAYQEEAQ
jgi:predicted amidohydrolase YtcJ